MSCNKTIITKKFTHTNDLIKETSPYLLQHAHNPVNWKSWNTKTLALAKKENKLMIISVGYSACHWCHVMEEESFENDSVAKIMNANFISIKVDREERPDVDKVYMRAVELMTGRGGWPLNCITLPDGRPIFGGTYFPRKQWVSILKQMSDLYKNDPNKVINFAEKLTKGIQTSETIIKNTKEVSFLKTDVSEAVKKWEKNLDFEKGGQINAPKFPSAKSFYFLMRYAEQEKDAKLKKFTETTLTKMAFGGIYDQIGGGFSRYSTDKEWHIPHFEKMLYDNAQLVSLYSNAYAKTKKELYKNTVTETLNFVERELLNKNGGFYCSLDADSFNEKKELKEGAYYAWKKDELKLLITSDFELFKEYYNINSIGLWENKKYILIRTASNTDFAKAHKISISELESKIKTWKKILFNERKKRQKPRLDDKILTSWNGLMLKAYVDAYKVFQNPKYLKIALKNA
ncbi:MAG: thioredoxin domain-containing protein, partial [Polaribacter sp.]